MKFQTIAHSLGIQEYPQILDSIYETKPLRSLCDRKLLRDLNRQYGLFGRYYHAVLQAMDDLEKDPLRHTWGQVVCTYILDAPLALSSRVPMPVSNGTPAGDMLPMLILLPLIPHAISIYREKGFSEADILELLTAYEKGIAIVEQRTGRPGVDQLYYWWLSLYAKASIFHCGGFNFELCALPHQAVYLRNRQSGTIIPVMSAGTFHASGHVLGSAGFEDPTSAFTAAFRETADAWYGHPVRDAHIENNEVHFPKALWDLILQPGDMVLSMHIPVGATFTADAVSSALAQARYIAEIRFPEHNSRGIYCHSWLLDPALLEILGERSNIARFGTRFSRHPVRSNGKEVFGYVFPAGSAIDETLPEGTRLQRALKQRYLSGSCIYAYAGVLV